MPAFATAAQRRSTAGCSDAPAPCRRRDRHDPIRIRAPALRSFPSCGGLQSPEIYLSVQHATDVAPGLYHYQPQQHALELIRDGNYGSAMSKIALDSEFVEKSAAVLIVTGSFERLRWKYGERAYRYMCVDAGCLTQNLYLVGEALGLAVRALPAHRRPSSTFSALTGRRTRAPPRGHRSAADASDEALPMER